MKLDFSDVPRGSVNSGRWILPGEYDVTVDVCKHINGLDSASFVAELVIEASNNPERPSGSSMDFTRKVAGGAYPKGGRRDVFEFFSVGMGIPFEELVDAAQKSGGESVHYNNAVHSKQPLKGVKLHLSATNSTNPRSGKSFTKLSWRKR